MSCRASPSLALIFLGLYAVRCAIVHEGDATLPQDNEIRLVWAGVHILKPEVGHRRAIILTASRYHRAAASDRREDPVATIVGVHGIAQQVRGPEVLKQEWLPALRDGLGFAGVRIPSDDDFACAFYGDLFRKKGIRTVGVPPLDASDVKGDLEIALLNLWWREAAAHEPGIPGPDAKTRVRTSQIVQRALNNLSKSRFFAGLSERLLIWDLKQVAAYLTDDAVRAQVQDRVAQAIGPATCVVVGHSLGSVAAYEALCAHPDWGVRTFVTLGSPLGIANLVFDRLRPPATAGVGAWPNVERWFNIADAGDIVALDKDLAKRFGPRVKDVLVHNGSKAHDVTPYLTAKETGEAIATGLQ